MIYKNKERVDSICKEIDSHMEKINDLCVAQTISIENGNGFRLFTIVVGPDSPDEYAHEGVAIINFIMDDLKHKIAYLHTDLEKL